MTLQEFRAWFEGFTKYAKAAIDAENARKAATRKVEETVG